MTAQIIPLTVSDLNTAINHEPRVRDLAIAERLGLANPRSIREMIDANKAELESYGSLSAVPTMIAIGKGGQREVTEYWLNEAQALLLCTFSRTAQAAQVRRSLITVFMDWRRGHAERIITVKEHQRMYAPKRKLAQGPEPLPAPASHSLPKPSEPTQAERINLWASIAVDIGGIRARCDSLEATFFPKAAKRRVS
ncbi:MAG: hypothetical protein IPI58_09715 [Alphaproteobacteria bacterium]|nr:MAG: hypothetical protein IPI58_09715 [Alphaproteobacteria bacterium]